MIVSINQPAYLPWLGYFHRIAVSDLHIVLDHVQFQKNSFQNRNKVRIGDSWAWLTVPVLTKGKFGDLAINTVEVNNSTAWRERHLHTIAQTYAKAPHFTEHAEFFRHVFEREWHNLGDLCRETTRYFLEVLGIKTPLVFSSEMAPQETKSELVLELCKKAGATLYLSGSLGRNYLSEESFVQAGIKVAYQDYRHPEYPQIQGEGFEPYMSIIDLLFNCGPGSLDVLMSGQEEIQLKA